MAALLAAGSASLAKLVAAELAGSAPSGKAARPQLLAAAVAHSVHHGKLEPRVLQKILQQYPEHPFVWRRVQDEAAEYEPENGAPSAYKTLGGLCVHALGWLLCPFCLFHVSCFIVLLCCCLPF